MPRVKNDEFITFNDGTMEICEAKNRTLVKTRQKDIRFGNQTVGVNRFWRAKVASNTVDRLVAIPPVPGISRSDICLIQGEQYKILQIQDKFDKYPPCLFLSLEREPVKYKDVREGA